MKTIHNHLCNIQEQIAGAFSPVVTKETRNNTWETISEVIYQDHPDCARKDVKAVKKKFTNFEGKARPIIRNFRAGLNETGRFCLPFNGSISFNLFESFSQVVAHHRVLLPKSMSSTGSSF